MSVTIPVPIDVTGSCLTWTDLHNCSRRASIPPSIQMALPLSYLLIALFRLINARWPAARFPHVRYQIHAVITFLLLTPFFGSLNIKILVLWYDCLPLPHITPQWVYHLTLCSPRAPMIHTNHTKWLCGFLLLHYYTRHIRSLSLFCTSKSTPSLFHSPKLNLGSRPSKLSVGRKCTQSLIRIVLLSKNHSTYHYNYSISSVFCSSKSRTFSHFFCLHVTLLRTCTTLQKTRGRKRESNNQLCLALVKNVLKQLALVRIVECPW